MDWDDTYFILISGIVILVLMSETAIYLYSRFRKLHNWQILSSAISWLSVLILYAYLSFGDLDLDTGRIVAHMIWLILLIPQAINHFVEREIDNRR